MLLQPKCFERWGPGFLSNVRPSLPCASTMTTVSTSVTDTLQHIALEARRWASRLSVHQQCTTAASTSHRHIDFYVPDPQPIIRDLLTTGLPQKFAEQISEAYLEKAFILKREFDCHIQRALSVCNDPIPDQSAKLSSLIKKTFLSRYTEVLKGWAETAMSMSRTYIAKSTTFDEHRVPETRTTFRQVSSASKAALSETNSEMQEALPALEEFFYQNPYPSRFEKKELANATGLQYKQIHTWVCLVNPHCELYSRPI